VDFSIILSLVGIVISIYTVADQTQKQNIRYKISYLHIILLILFSVFLLITLVAGEYYNAVNPSLQVENDYFSLSYTVIASLISLLILILISILAGYIIFNKKIVKKKKLVSKLKEDFYNNSFVQIINSLDYYFDNLNKYYLPEGRKATTRQENLSRIFQNKDTFNKFELAKNYLYNFINKNRIRYSTKFDEMLQLLFLNENFIEELADRNPYFFVTILESKLQINYKEQFVEQFLEYLILENNDLLFFQVNNTNEIYLKNDTYKINSENYLIYYLFKDIELANDLKAWKNIGEPALSYLDNVNDQMCLELKTDIYVEEKAGDSVVYNSIKIFDIMLRRALEQNASTFMRLDYYSHFINKIARNYRCNSIDIMCLEKEFLNIYDYSIYQIFYNLISWIKISFNENIDYSIELEQENCEFEGGNIPKASIIIATQSLETIVNRKIRKKLIDKILNLIIDLYFSLELEFNEEAKQYSNVLLSCLHKRDDETKTALKKILNNYDYIPQFNKIDGTRAVRKIKNSFNVR
jgi:hypothetical protein